MASALIQVRAQMDPGFSIRETGPSGQRDTTFGRCNRSGAVKSYRWEGRGEGGRNTHTLGEGATFQGAAGTFQAGAEVNSWSPKARSGAHVPPMPSGFAYGYKL